MYGEVSARMRDAGLLPKIDAPETLLMLLLATQTNNV